MNEVKHIRIVIDAYEWEGLRKKALADFDDFLAKLRTKDLLTHYGNVTTHFEYIEDKNV